jgi:hypothetical protein
MRALAHSLLLILFTSTTGQCQVTTDNGKSYFAPQPIGVMLAPQTSQFEQFCRENKDEQRFFIAATPFFSRSNAGKELRRMFLPDGKDELVIAGSEAANAADADVSGTWLKIMGNDPVSADNKVGLLYNNFQSKISVDPLYEQMGTQFNFYTPIAERFFISVDGAFVQSKVMHKLTEVDVQNMTDRVTTNKFLFIANNTAIDQTIERREPVSSLYSLNATEAFSNQNLLYGKLSTTPLKTEGLSDVNLKAGINFEHGSLFARMQLPTSKKSTAQYMFEPMTGSGSHWGFGLGGNLKLEAGLPSLGATLQLHNSVDYLYMLENTQRRTFDLADNGSWSRYLLMRDIGGTNSTPGVNYLTLPATVTPGHTVNWQTRAGLKINKAIINLGYSFYFAEQEKIRVADNAISNKFNIASEQLVDLGAAVVGDNFVLNDRFFPTATIDKKAGNLVRAVNPTPGTDRSPLVDATDGEVLTSDRAISVKNLNLQSATQPAKLVSQVSLSVGTEQAWQGMPVSLTAGYSYNLDHNKTALGGWQMWLQCGLAI